jgi:hypothetical protein
MQCTLHVCIQASNMRGLCIGSWFRFAISNVLLPRTHSAYGLALSLACV